MSNLFMIYWLELGEYVTPGMVLFSLTAITVAFIVLFKSGGER